MKATVHISEHRYFRHGALAHKNGVLRVETHSWNIDIRKMVGTEDVLLFRIEFGLAFNIIRQEAKS